MEELAGFEPAMTVLQTVSLAYLDTTPKYGVECKIRTCGPNEWTTG